MAKVRDFAPFRGVCINNKPPETTHEAIGRCGHCKTDILLYFRAKKYDDLTFDGFSLPDYDMTTVSIPDRAIDIALIGSHPIEPKASAPEHLPENVRKSFLGAEKARLAGLWTEAAASYGKAVDRGISPLLPNDKKRRTLGQKLYDLKKSGGLAPSLVTWIDVILEDRNFAAHDDDLDFESAEEIETIREFANICLTYLYTMPRKVELARQDADDRKARHLSASENPD